MNGIDRILVVDDEKTIVFALKTYFAREGHIVDSAHSAEEAFKLLADNRYTVAILDIHLSGPAVDDGLSIAAYIREHAPATFVIMLTAMETAEVEQRAAEVGVHSMLRKPMRLAHVADVARGLVSAAEVN